MSNAVAVLTAYIICCNGIHIFREPKEVGPGPLVSCYIFTFGAMLLLYDLSVYPQSLRKLGILSQGITEFFLATFLLENIMMDFWFPLEIALMNFPKHVAYVVEELLQTGDWTFEEFSEFLKDESTGFIVSYMCSISFLIFVLHAIRAIDLRAFQEGPDCFFGDISFRLRRFIKKKMRALGIGAKRRVQIKEECYEPASDENEVCTCDDYDMGSDL